MISVAFNIIIHKNAVFLFWLHNAMEILYKFSESCKVVYQAQYFFFLRGKYTVYLISRNCNCCKSHCSRCDSFECRYFLFRFNGYFGFKCSDGRKCRPYCFSNMMLFLQQFFSELIPLIKYYYLLQQVLCLNLRCISWYLAGTILLVFKHFD